MAEMTENLIRLKTAPGVGNATLWRLLRHFGNSDRILGADEAELAALKGIGADKARRILAAGKADPRPEMEKAVRAGVNIIPYDDPEYPKPLLHSFDPPVVLYVWGRLLREDQVAVGIVGTRRASPYGRSQALSLAEGLARGGYCIVSGLARGIDTFAHIGALNAGGRTVGVLGCGFDHMYPEENRDLALEMTRNGAVVSEFSMATPPSRDTFPTRNRIIAGMSLGLIVIEAPLRSGSLITARLANEIGRTVFALPGRVGDAASEGCNKLIRDGAVIATTIDDIFNELNPALPLPAYPERKKNASPPLPSLPSPSSTPTPTPTRAPTPPKKEPKPESTMPNPRLDADQRKLLETITGEWQSVDALAEAAALAVGKAVAGLSMLKLMCLVEQGPGQTYRRLRG